VYIQSKNTFDFRLNLQLSCVVHSGLVSLFVLRYFYHVGCGWPQHMLCPRGTAEGMVFDLVVFITNGQDDRVNQPTRRPTNQTANCRDAMSFCGILDQLYPDSKPMNYPFDKAPFNAADGVTVVPTLDDYVSRISNMSTIQVNYIESILCKFLFISLV